MAFTQITVTGQWLRPGRHVGGGEVEFVLTNRIVNGGGVAPDRIVAPVVGGHMSVQLAATDDPDTAPAGALYRVIERIPALGRNRDYYIAVPHDAGTIDLGTATHLDLSTAPRSGTAPVTHDELDTALAGAGGLTGDQQAKLAAAVTSQTVTAIVTLTQAEYDGLTPDPDTLYVVVE